MNKQLARKIVLILLSISLLFGQVDQFSGKHLLENTDDFENKDELSFSDESSTDRVTYILNDIKILLTDAIMADINHDTLEVIYILNRIYDLLGEADQSEDQTSPERAELDRFASSLTDIFTQSFHTLDLENAPISAAYTRKMIEDLAIPVEMGNTKFIVIDDRDGHIPIVRTKTVDQFITYFQTKGKDQFQLWLNRMNEYGYLIKKILAEKQLPEELLYLSMIESGLNPKAYSRASAVGMWQFMYSTGKLYGLNRDWYMDERRDPIKATYAACDHLYDLYTEFDHWYLAMAAYNAGAGRIRRAIRLHQTSDFWQLSSLPRETRNYVPYFMAAAIIARNPEAFGFVTNSENQKGPFQFETVSLEQSADLNVLAKAANIDLETIRYYNPELRQSATPQTQTYMLRLPMGKTNEFTTNFYALPKEERFAPQYLMHVVHRGETLSTISGKYKISIHDLLAVNKIKNKHEIRIGQKLTIPVRGTFIPPPEPSGQDKVIYTVRRGDNLGKIAANFGTKVGKIRSWNNISGDNIYPGQKLVLWVKQG